MQTRFHCAKIRAMIEQHLREGDDGQWLKRDFDLRVLLMKVRDGHGNQHMANTGARNEVQDAAALFRELARELLNPAHALVDSLDLFKQLPCLGCWVKPALDAFK